MKLFILAAGKGTRLMPLTKNTPKSLIDLGDGVTILERQINVAIESKLFNEIIIITGYKAEQIDAKIKEYEKQIKITPIYNPFYDKSNNLMSLWAVHYRMLEDDFMITNGDNTYMLNVFEAVQNSDDECIQITIDYKNDYDDDDMKVILDNNKNALRVHKQIDLADTNAESVGLTLVKGERSRKAFVNKILQLAAQKEHLNSFWLEVFNYLIEDGVTITTAEIGHDQWQEVDFHPDIEMLKEIITKKNN